MTTLLSVLTGTTCGEACWEAAEDVCRCSCNGSNHGILRSPDGKRPVRTSKIDGYRYTLTAVGSSRECSTVAAEINKAAGVKDRIKVTATLTYEYFWKETDKGAPCRVRTASASEVERWPELAHYRGQDWRARYFNTPYLAWVREA